MNHPIITTILILLTGFLSVAHGQVPGTLFHDDFEQGPDPAWSAIGGDWLPSGGALVGSGRGEYQVGYTAWRLRRFAADLTRLDGSDVYLILEGDHWFIHANLRSGVYQDVLVSDGLDTHSLPFPNGNGVRYRLELVVEPGSFDVVVDGAVLATLPLQGAAAGGEFNRAGLGLWGNDCLVEFDDVIAEGVETPSLLFAEDFTGGADEAWESQGGDWSVDAGVLAGSGRGEHLVLEPSWDITRAAASVRRGPGGDAYVALRNRHTFVHANLRGGVYQDLWIHDGAEYHSVPFPNEADAWYRIELSLAGTHLAVAVDGATLAGFELQGAARTAPFYAYALGLWGEAADNRYDDVEVSGTRAERVLFHDDFNDGLPGPWLADGGAWNEAEGLLAGSGRGEYRVRLAAAAIARGAVTATRTAGSDIYIALENERSFIRANLRAGVYQDIWVHDGVQDHSLPFPNQNDTAYRLALVVRDIDFDVVVDQAVVGTLPLRGHAAWRPFDTMVLGLWGNDADHRFDDVLLWGYDTDRVVDVDPAPHPAPRAQAVPNPFNPSTRIHFSLPEPADVAIDVFDMRGHRVRRLCRGVRFEAGAAAIAWNGEDDAGRAMPTGVYFFRLMAGSEVTSGKMLLVE